MSNRPQTTDQTYNPNMSYAWGAAAQIDLIVQADDPDLWEHFFRFLRERQLMDVLLDYLADQRV